MAGVVAAGHEKTAEAAKVILDAGGNAFDAAVAAVFMSCVAEPTLASLGGGGFLLAHPASGKNLLFDFFTQTPGQRSHQQHPDFYPIKANFGDTVQVFHIGLGSIAVPGVFAGLIRVHGQLGRLPLSVVVEPAVISAREGLLISGFQGYCYELLEPILMATAGTREIYAPKGSRLKAGEHIYMSKLGDTLEHLASLGDFAALRAFYEGEIAQQTVRACQESGGFLTMADFEAYEVRVRSPLSINYRGTQLLTNPLPSAGGSLIAFCLELLERFELGQPQLSQSQLSQSQSSQSQSDKSQSDKSQSGKSGLSQIAFGTQAHLQLLSQAMRWTNEARRDYLDRDLFDPNIIDKFLSDELIEKYAEPIRDILSNKLNRWGSTTHISVMDDEGNAASVTTSNGEGSSYVVPGTHIMMNNMLGEEDLNPLGFNLWPTNQRMSSMMSPTMILKDSKPQLVLGSGGSNRIRTAILQVISNVLDFGMPLSTAVAAPRIHWEGGTFHIEPGFDNETVQSCEITEMGHTRRDRTETDRTRTKQIVRWQQPNMFFGGVHAVGVGEDGTLQGAGDPRRNGAIAHSQTQQYKE